MDPSQEDVSFVRKNELFSDMAEEDLSLICSLMKKMQFKEGEFIIHEGEEGKNIYLIKSGKVEVIKREKQDGEPHQLSVLASPECFGEMVLFGEGTKHSATIRALEPAEIIAIPIVDAITQNSKISLKMAKHITERLRGTNEVAVKALNTQLKVTKANAEMGHVLIHLFILLTLYFYTFKAFSQYGAETTINKVIIALLIIGFGISAALVVGRGEFPLKYYGLTLKNWKRDTWEGVLFTLPVLLIMLLGKLALISFVPAFQKLPLFISTKTANPVMAFFHLGQPQEQHFYLFMLIYILLVPVQEFIVRGCLQNCLENFFQIPHKIFWAILVSNILFGMFHGFRTTSLAIAAFAVGIFWGWLYARQRSIVGPTISHILIGVWAFLFLDLTDIFIY